MAKHLRFLFYLLLTVVWSVAGNAQTVVFEETFDKCNGSGGNDGNFNATAASAKVDMNFFDNDGWTYSTNVYKANKALKLASGSAQGKITSPTIKVNSENKITLVVDAGACTGKKPSMKVSVSNATVTPNSATLAEGKFQEYSFSLSDITGDIQITITIPLKQQSYINNVKVINESIVPTKTTFGSGKDKSTVTLAKGKLGGDIFKGYTASETTDIAGTLKYESSATDVATVDETTGEVTFKGFGTTIITATFTPEDTETYSVSKAFYTIVNENKLSDAKIAFEKDTYKADVNKGTYEGIKLTNPYNLPVTYTTSSSDLSYDDDRAVYKQGENATYTITATFEGNDDYEPATASCTLIVKDPYSDSFVFVAGTDKGKGYTGDISAEYLTKESIKIESDRANLHSYKDYRFYKGLGSSSKGGLTVSTTQGVITKIIFEGTKLTNLSTTVGDYKNGVWTGNAQSIYFRATDTANPTKITVITALEKQLILDEDQDYHNAAYDNYTVTLKRNLVKDEWNTFCVPFDITEEEAKEAFGDDVKICAFQNATATTVNFKAVTSIKKSKPYLIKPSIDTPADGYKFTLKPINSNAVEVEGTAGSVQMRGTYGPTDITTFAKGNTFAAGLGEDNTILKATSGAQMRGYRAFFLVPTSLEGQTLKANISGIITAIDAIHGVDKADAPVYNLNGQRVTGELKAGIYVKNGKKFIVK